MIKLKNLLLTLLLFAFANSQETLTYSGSITGVRTVGTAFNVGWNHGYQRATTVNLELYSGTTRIRILQEAVASTNTSTNVRSVTTPHVIDGTNYAIRVVSNANTSISAQSNTFTISNDITQTITISSGTNWNIGATALFVWNAGGSTVRVDIYSTGSSGVFLYNLVERTTGTSVSWAIPTSLPVGAYQLRISRIDQPDVFVSQTLTFSTPNTRTLALTSPTANYVAFNGETMTLSCTRSGFLVGETQRFDLFNSTNDFVMNIASGVSSNSYTWVVPEFLADSRVYRIRCTHDTIASVTSLSSNFEVRKTLGEGTTSGYINVTSSEFSNGFKKAYRLHNPGNCWELYVEGFSSNINDRLEIFDGDNNLSPALDTLSGTAVPLGKRVQSSGSYLYARFSVITATTGFVLVRYASIACTTPSFNFISPPVGSSYTVGDTLTISWLEKGDITYSLILFRKGTQVLALVSDNAVSPRTYTLPSDLVFGTDYNFLISSIDPSFPSQTIQFTVYPARALTWLFPNTLDQVYQRQQIVNTQWLSVGFFDVVNVALRKGGVNQVVHQVSSPHSVGGSRQFVIPDTALLGNDYTFRVSNGSTFADSPRFSVQSVCDADVTVTTGGSGNLNISSSQYIYNNTCRSTVVSSARQCLRVTFTTFSLGTGDFIRIYEGDQTASTVIKELSWNATDSSTPITSSGFAVTVRFFSSSSGGFGNGYQFSYLAVACPTSLEVLTPSGKSLWAKQQPAGTYVIQWNTTAFPGGNAKIDLADVGSAYNVSLQTLTASIATNVGFFTGFTLPATLTDYKEYVIRISSVYAPSYFQENTFTALPSAANRIIVTNPNHLTNLNRRNDIVVSWTSLGVSASQNVRIDLYAGTEFKATLANNVNSTFGTNSIQIPDTYLTSNRYRVYVTQTTDSGISGESPVFFINQNAPSSLTILDPTHNELVPQYSFKAIRWSRTGLSDNVNILLYSGGVFVRNIALGVNATFGTANYTFNSETQGSYTLYIVRAEGFDVLATRDFYVVGTKEESIYVIQPYADQIVTTEGSAATIQWNWRGLVERVNIDLLFRNTALEALATNITNTGLFTWTLPYNTVPYGIDYRVRVSEVGNSTNSGTSSAFTVAVTSQEKITVTRPTASIMTWGLGSVQSIVWTYSSGVQNVPSLNIELYSGGRLYRRIAHGIKTTVTSFSWTVPTDLEVDKPYRLIIFGSSSRSVLGVSPKFWVTSVWNTVGVTGNANLHLGNFYTASWTGNTPLSFDVDLHDSNNNKLWNVAKKVPATNYAFYPPTGLSNDNTTNYRIKVTELSNTGFNGLLSVTEQPACSGVLVQAPAGSVSLTGRLGNVRCSYVFRNPNNLCYLFEVSSNTGFDFANDALEFYDGQDASGIKFAQYKATSVDANYLMKSASANTFVTFKTGSSSSQSLTLIYRTVECQNPELFVETPHVTEENGRVGIRWNSKHFQSTIATVELFTSSNALVSSSGNIRNSGFYNQFTLAASTQSSYYVKVTLRGDSLRSYSGRSDYFTITGDITITAPNSYTPVLFTAGSSMTVSWVNSFESQSFTVLLLGVTGTTYSTLVNVGTFTSGTSSTLFTIPSNLEVHDSYAVRLVPSNPSLYHAPFYQVSNLQIRRPSQLVNAIQNPSGASRWSAGETHNIRWTHIGEYNEVTIDLHFQNGTYIQRIVQNVANTGNYSWTVPSQFTDTVNQYQVRVSPARLVQQAAYRASSNFNFFDKCVQNFTTPTSTSALTITTGQSSECLRVIMPTNARCINTQLTINIGSNDRVVVYNGILTTSPVLETITGPISITKFYESYTPISYFVKLDTTPAGSSVSHTYNTNCDQKLVVHNPSRFGAWKVGTTQNIQYIHVLNSATTNVQVTLHRTSSGDTVLATVAASTAIGAEYDGRISWTIPGTLPAANDYFFRFTQLPTAQPISATNVLILTDSHAFSLSTADPKFSITAPAAFATWNVGQSQTITWSTTGTSVPNVNIDLYSGGRSLFVLRVASNIANTGSFAYSIPTHVQPGYDYHFVVTDASNIQSIGVSNSVVLDEANVGTLTITSQPPTTITAGTQFTFSFTKSSEIPYTDIILFSGLKAVGSIQSLFLGTTTNVTISNTGNDYRLALVNGLNANVRVFSNTFTVTQGTDNTSPAIYVGSPNVGDTLNSQETQQSFEIKWVWSSTIANVNIELFHSTNSSTGTVKVLDIASNIENLGYYTWAIPNNLLNSNRYVVKVSNVANVAINGLSGEFTISSPISYSVGHLAPVASVSPGLYSTIGWIPDTQSKFVDLYVGSDRYVWRLIAQDLPNDGQYLWEVPKDVVLGNYEVIVVPKHSETAVSVLPVSTHTEQSITTFGVSVSSLFSSFGSPSYTTAAVGNTYTISWSISTSNTNIRLYNITNVHIDLHFNGGNLVQAIACNVPAGTISGNVLSGSYSWTVQKDGLTLDSLNTVDVTNRVYQVKIYTANTSGIYGTSSSFRIREQTTLTTNCGIIKSDVAGYLQNQVTTKDRYWNIDLRNTPNTLGCIRFYFKSMDILSGDSLQIYDSADTDTTNGASFQVVGTSTPPEPFQIYGRQAVVRFTTPSAPPTNPAQGFEIQYAHVECSSRIRVSSFTNPVTIGETGSLTWTCGGNTNAKLDIFLLLEGSIFRQLASNVTCSDASLTWTAPTELAEGTQYSYYIRANNGISYAQTSSTFQINARPKFLFVSPLTVIKSSTTRIFWSHHGLQEANVLFRVRNTVTGSTITSVTITNVGFYDWVVPTVSSNECEYDLVMELLQSTTLTATATATVYICRVDQPDIRVLTPSFFPLNIGSKYIVQYFSHKVKSVDVYLKENDEQLTTITKLANNTSPVGYVTVDIPSTLTLGRNYIITVEDALVNGGANSSFHFTAVQKKCEYNLSGTFGNVSLPSYSQGFNWDSCTWQISNPCGSSIRFVIVLQTFQSCETVNVYDRNLNGTLLASFGSGSTSLNSIDSISSSIYVKFQSCAYVTAPTSSITSPFFRFLYTSVQCKNQITGILRPTRVSNVVVGVPFNIKWSSQNPSTFVKVELLQNNVVISTISPNTTGSDINWSPATSGLNYKVRISNLGSTSNVIESAPFQVRTGVWDTKAVVSAPTTIRQAVSYVVTFNTTQSGLADIDLYRGSEFIQRLAYDVSGNSTTVTIPWALPSDYYRFVVVDALTGRYTESDVFSITPNTPSIIVNPMFSFYTQPVIYTPAWSGLEADVHYTHNLINGRLYYIKWSFSGPQVDDVRDLTVKLYSGNTLISNVGSTTFNAPHFAWTVPSETTNGLGKHNKYRLQLVATQNSMVQGWSQEFTISPSTTLSVCPPVALTDQITLTMSPQSFEAGSIVPITWTSIGRIPYVTISVESAGSVINLSEGCVPNTQLFNWVVPSNLNGRYTVRITGVNTTVPATSNSSPSLSIKGVPTTYTFTSPVANDRWAANETRTITWDNQAATALAIPSQVRIFANGVIISNTSSSETVPNTGSYVWDIKNYVTSLGNAAFVNNFTLTITGSTTYKGTTYTLNGRSGVFFIEGVKLNAASGMTGFVSLTIICSLIALIFA